MQGEGLRYWDSVAHGQGPSNGIQADILFYGHRHFSKLMNTGRDWDGLPGSSPQTWYFKKRIRGYLGTPGVSHDLYGAGATDCVMVLRVMPGFSSAGNPAEPIRAMVGL